VHVGLNSLCSHNVDKIQCVDVLRTNKIVRKGRKYSVFHTRILHLNSARGTKREQGKDFSFSSVIVSVTFLTGLGVCFCATCVQMYISCCIF
jgi:hypothetical protein